MESARCLKRVGGGKHAPNAECESTRPAAFIPVEMLPDYLSRSPLDIAHIVENISKNLHLTVLH